MLPVVVGLVPIYVALYACSVRTYVRTCIPVYGVADVRYLHTYFATHPYVCTYVCKYVQHTRR